MPENKMKWYVLRAVSGKESKVKEYIDAEIRNSNLGQFVSQVLIPTEKVYQLQNGKRVTKERSYLPGYVLVEALLNGEVTGHLRDVPNVIGFLGATPGGQPLALRQDEVNRMLGMYDQMQEAVPELIVPYEVDEMVKVINGPFSGFSAKIEEVNTDRKKLKVMVTIFGRKTPLELSFTQVEKE